MKNNTKTQNAVATIRELGIFARNHCFRRLLVFALVGVTASLVVAKTAQADNLTLYSTSFEQPTFQDGDQLLGLDGWSTAIPPFLNPQAAIVTNLKARDGEQSMEVHGEHLFGSEGITAPYDAVGSYRKPLNYSVSPAKFTVIVEADLLLETNQPATPGEFFSLTIAARSGNGKTVGEIGLSSAGIVEAFAFDSPPGASPVFSQTILFNQWYHITMLLDYAGERTSYLVNGEFLGTVRTTGASKGLERASMVVYARPNGGVDGGTGSARSNYTARFDTFRVRVSE